MERSKFNVDKDKEKRTYNNIVFDSQLEMNTTGMYFVPQWKAAK